MRLMATILLVMMFCHAHCNTLLPTKQLYLDESIYDLNNTQALVKFRKGAENKPLVIFIPGGANLARIAYGYPGGNPRDFMDYWLSKAEFSFMGISYPSDNKVFTKLTPDFTIQDWGNQVMHIAKVLIKRNKLPDHVIIAAWSMAGVSASALSDAAYHQGLTIDLFVSLAATPPLPDLISDQENTIRQLPNGLSDRITLRTKRFLAFIHEENDLNKHIIIPDNIYKSDFLTNVPVNLLNTAIRYQKGNFVKNFSANIADTHTFHYANYPFIAVIHGDSLSDAQHVLTDKMTWFMLASQMIYRRCKFFQEGVPIANNKWQHIRTLIDSLPEQFLITIPGNHFFFIGEKGAKNTVDALIHLYKKSKFMQYELKQSCGYT